MTDTGSLVNATATLFTTFNETTNAMTTVSSTLGSMGILIILFVGLGLVWSAFGRSSKDYKPSETVEVPDYDRDYDPKDYDCKKGKHAFQKLRLKQGGRDEVKLVCVLCGKDKGVGYSWK